MELLALSDEKLQKALDVVVREVSRFHGLHCFLAFFDFFLLLILLAIIQRRRGERHSLRKVLLEQLQARVLETLRVC